MQVQVSCTKRHSNLQLSTFICPVFLEYKESDEGKALGCGLYGPGDAINATFLRFVSRAT